MKISGNVIAEILIYSSSENEIGEVQKKWKTVQVLKGFIDMLGEKCEYEKYNRKIQESTHVFICDFVPLVYEVTAEQARLKIGSKIYDVMYIDNPLELGRHYEIYIKSVI